MKVHYAVGMIEIIPSHPAFPLEGREELEICGRTLASAEDIPY